MLSISPGVHRANLIILSDTSLYILNDLISMQSILETAVSVDNNEHSTGVDNDQIVLRVTNFLCSTEISFELFEADGWMGLSRRQRLPR